MIELALLVGFLVLVLLVVVYLLGYQVATADSITRVKRLRAESTLASHQLDEITRDAFAAMADHAKHRRQSGTQS